MRRGFFTPQGHTRIRRGLATPSLHITIEPAKNASPTPHNTPPITNSSPLVKPKITRLDKILLTREMKPIEVSPYDYKVVACNEKDEVLMFTCGLNNSIGVAASNNVNNKKTLGLAHLEERLQARDFPTLTIDESYTLILLSTYINQLNHDSIEKILDAFQPYGFNQLIDQIKKTSGSHSVIDIYLGGGGYRSALSQIYSEYVKTRYDLRLCDTALNPYQLTPSHKGPQFSEEVLKKLSSTFGISSTGDVVLVKETNLNLNGITNDATKIETPSSFFSRFKYPQPDPNSAASMANTAKF